MANIIIVNEQYYGGKICSEKSCQMIIKIGNQPNVTYNNITLEEALKFILSHNELISVITSSQKIHKFLVDKIDFYNIELQLRVS